MSPSQRIFTGPRLLLGLLLIAVLLAYHNLGQSPSPSSVPMASSSSPNPIEGLQLSLAQVPDASPTTIRITVTNTGSSPVTLLTYDSPLDPSALPLGLLSITPAGASAPLDLPVAHFRRIWPPTRSLLVALAPGESTYSDVFFRETVVTAEELGEKATVVVRGQWTAVWAKGIDEVSDAELNDPQGSAASFQGSFASEPLEVTVIP